MSTSGEPTPRAVSDDRCLHELFEGQVVRGRGVVAVRCGGREVSYGELDGLANGLAVVLRGLGVGPDVVVGVCVGRSVELVVALLGVLKAGGGYVPLDPSYPVGRLRGMLSDCGASVVVSAGGVGGWLAGSGVVVVEVGGSSSAVGAASGVVASNVAYCLYTSGSTGRPKAVVLEHRNAVNLVRWFVDRFSTDDLARVLFATSACFDLSIIEIFATLAAGTTMELVPNVLALAEPQATGDIAPTLLNTVPSAARVLADADAIPPSVRVITLAGEPLRSDLVHALRRAAPRARVVNLYGPTETTTYMAGTEITDPDRITIGHPFPGTDVMILDERLRRVPHGDIGELYVSGPLVTRGYWRRPALTGERYLPNPFGPPGSRMYRTGDLARYLPTGEIECHGRVDHQVKVRGFRVELGEIEAALLACSEVDNAAVMLRDTDSGEPRLVAYVVADPAVMPGVRDRIAAELPDYMLPSAYVHLDRLPLNRNDKLDRAALPPPAPADDPPAAPPGPGTHPARHLALCRLAARVLRRDHVGPDDNLYDLGGSSLTAAALAAAVRTELGAELSAADILRYPTPAQWAARIEERPSVRPPITPAVGPGPRPASYAQQNLWLVDQLTGAGARYNEPFAIRLRGPLEVPALHAALVAVANRHEPLRTTLELVGGTLTQRVRAVGEVALRTAEVSEAELPDAVRDALRHPFDLAQDLPMRAWLFRLADAVDTHVLLVVIHHVACDGSSTGPFWRDVATAYNTGSAPPPLPVRYTDFAVWQRHLLDPDADPHGLVGRQSRFWSAALAGTPEVTGLPTDRPRTDHRRADGGTVALRISPARHARLAAFARTRAATVFTVVHAALTALLARRGAGPDVVIGAVVSGRVDAALDELVGFFANTVVLRVDASGDPTFTELLDRVRRVDLAAMANQDLPFERVVDLVNPARRFSHAPLVQVMLAFQARPVEPPPLAGLETRFEPVDVPFAQFDLCLQVVEQVDADDRPAGMTGSVTYTTDILDRSTVTGLVDDLLLLLDDGLDRPTTRIRARAEPEPGGVSVPR